MTEVLMNNDERVIPLVMEVVKILPDDFAIEFYGRRFECEGGVRAIEVIPRHEVEYEL